MNIKRYFAELLGTFGLALAVRLSLASGFPLATPIVAALTLGLFVYTIGHISGAHLNPAVTIGAWSLSKIGRSDALWYIIMQFLGGAIAYVFSGAYLAHAFPLITVVDSFPVALAEFAGMFFFAFGVAAVISGRVPSMMNGIIVGGSLLLGILVASVVSNGVLNPAVAVGIGSFSLVYLVAPIVGALLGMQVYRMLSE